MKYYFIAGEASGDLHASNLIKELKKLDANASIRAWGGDKMTEAGATVVKHYRDLAFMGFVEVVRNIGAIFKNFKECKADITAFAPDVLVLVDYPGFNLRMAKWAHHQSYKTLFYISPQVWAWKESRVRAIKKYVDRLLVILPFEKAFFQKHNMDVDYVGHPLIHVIEEFKQAHTHLRRNDRLIALLPGSRKQEIHSKLPVMLETTKFFPNYQFVVSKAPGIDDSFYESFLENYPNVKTAKNNTYAVFMQATAALVTSGTATLETALFEVPEIVCYKTSPISYAIAKRIIKLKFISLVNLIMDKEVVKELIQDDMNAKTIRFWLDKLLHDAKYRSQQKEDYMELRALLTAGGNASANAAKIVWETLSKK